MTDAPRCWRGPALDHDLPGVQQLRPRTATSTAPPRHTSWNPYSPNSEAWKTRSILQLARQHDNALASLAAPPVLESSSSCTSLRGQRPPRDFRRRDFRRPPGASRDTTALVARHFWPPHSLLTANGKRPELPSTAALTRTASFSDIPRIRSPLLSRRETDVRGVWLGTDESKRPASVASPRPRTRLARSASIGYRSPRPSPSTYGITSTHAGVGRMGYWGSS